MADILYDRDFVAWAETQAQLLRSSQWDQVDWQNLIEEVEDLARRYRDALKSQLIRLLMHLLKWQYQPEKRSQSWISTIKEARKQIRRLCSDYPSLKPYLIEILVKCYAEAVEDAVDETGLIIQTFPQDCPFELEQIIEHGFPDEEF